MKTLRFLLIAPFLTFSALAADSSAPAAPGKIAPLAVAQADPAAVESVLKALHYDEILDKALVQQRQLVQQMMMRMRIPGATKEDIAAFKQETLDAAFAGLTVEEIHAVAARNYGETFTTDELRAVADFYNTPAGQAFATKRAQAELKIGGIRRSRMMEAMQKVQKMTRDFVTQQQAKAQENAAKEAAKAKDQKDSGTPAAPVAPATSATPAQTLPPKP
jgi:hypothetical protein